MRKIAYLNTLHSIKKLTLRCCSNLNSCFILTLMKLGTTNFTTTDYLSLNIELALCHSSNLPLLAISILIN